MNLQIFKREEQRSIPTKFNEMRQVKWEIRAKQFSPLLRIDRLRM